MGLTALTYMIVSTFCLAGRLDGAVDLSVGPSFTLFQTLFSQQLVDRLHQNFFKKH